MVWRCPSYFQQQTGEQGVANLVESDSGQWEDIDNSTSIAASSERLDEENDLTCRRYRRCSLVEYFVTLAETMYLPYRKIRATRTHMKFRHNENSQGFTNIKVTRYFIHSLACYNKVTRSLLC